MAGVEFTGVGKAYGKGGHAVKDVTLTVAEGEFLVLVGPSGCGKSTLLRMVAGLEEITDGSIKIGGRVVNDVAPRDRDVAMVFQNYALYPHMTVFENLAFGLTLRKVPKDEIQRRVETAAGVLGLDRYLTRQPRALSGGERQRVALGRAMVREPKVFLFDEPLSNLDARLRVEMRAEIRRLHQRVGATMIYVTHDQVEAMTMGDRIAVLKKGELQQCADPRTLYSRPANTFVAGFIGTPPINLCEAGVTAAGDAIEISGTRFAVGAVQRAALVGRAGTRVQVGVRPEDLLLADAGLPAKVELVEPLGSETLVHLASAAGALVLRITSGAIPSPGDSVHVSGRADGLLLFDAGTGRALLDAETLAAHA
ncbi:MAG: sn-glycerol-3-phosphate ABC transporter ATP-binding protein UgpC [Candidatus Eisenbacteria bacterium]|nr:sn-glycerol-3-phosphate ABC transporter ATP-binding protein UgpC [Candidatus Eisenbacteria bacterium]